MVKIFGPYMEPSGASMNPKLMNVTSSASPLPPYWLYENNLSLSITHRIVLEWYNVLMRRNTRYLF